MARIVLDRTWIHLMSDYGNPVVGGTDSRTQEFSIRGEVQQFATGRTRSISMVGRRQVLGVNMRILTGADVRKLHDWMGEPTLLRDPWGRKVYGTFYSLNVKQYREHNKFDVAFMFHEIYFDDRLDS